MAVTKKDLSQIRGVVHDEVENLARIVARGFEAVEKCFELVDKRFEQVDRKLLHIDARLNTIEHDISEIRKHFVYRDEFEDALTRLTVVEKKLGIKSGK